jgi:prepilin-type N-terminal cleavage/methylation domain-containing protein
LKPRLEMRDVHLRGPSGLRSGSTRTMPWVLTHLRERGAAGRVHRSPASEGRLRAVAAAAPAAGPRPKTTGSTLIELVVVLAILGIVAGVVGLSFRGAGEHERDTPRARIAAARRQALEQRHAVTVTVTIAADGATREMTAFPDGRVVGDTLLGIDPLTGRPRAR